MLHDIEGSFENGYRQAVPHDNDEVLAFAGDALLMHRDGDDVELPTVKDLGATAGSLTYLFRINDTAYYLSNSMDAQPSRSVNGGVDAGQVDGWTEESRFRFEPLGMFRWIRPRETRFAVEVGWQLWRWYQDHRFCGRCGAVAEPNHDERMLRCPVCGNMVYPRINPGVIVGVTDGEHLLLTQYAGRGFTNWALVAGFTEIGESLEQTVAREVMEETGVRVKDIRYFGNQPWPRSSSLLVGYFATLDGPRDVTLDDAELARAEWVHWSDVPHEPDDYSLTRTMMCAFHDARENGGTV